ncbi:MAG: type VI secretion system tip protein TssI/VgrG, partial [Methylococcaceae bacterium]
MTTQKHREVEIETPLGTDVLLLKKATISEALSQPFDIDLQLLSRQEDIHFEDLLGENATLRIELPESQTRYFNGNFSDFSQTGNSGDFAVYHATLRPWLWFLSQTTDCRIYQNKTVPEIIKGIFRDYGFSDFEERLSQDYHEWNYCVLYRESYFDFVSRLMEREGIYYYFRHDNGKHTLVL